MMLFESTDSTGVSRGGDSGEWLLKFENDDVIIMLLTFLGACMQQYTCTLDILFLKHPKLSKYFRLYRRRA